MENDKLHVLVVDDDDRIRGLLKDYLANNDYIVSTAENASQAKVRLEYIKFDIEGMWYEFCEDVFKNNLQVLQINGEFEMNYDSQDLAFNKLNSVIEMFESQGYKIYCNRKLDTWNIELSFIRPELV